VVHAVACIAWIAPPVLADLQLEAYSVQIRPLLAEQCFSCHGGLKQEAGLRLDTVALMAEGGESGAALVKGDPDKSLLLQRVTDPDPASRMPPEGEGVPLSVEQVAMLSDWIKAGCPAPADEKQEADPRDHWAFQPWVRPAVPTVKNTAWAKNPIDAFLARKHDEAGIAPQPEAPRHVLVRRLYLDLIGLPPQPEELAAIEADASGDWYTNLVDKLLADPRHGERWGRHWMDVWRYADWWGLGDQLRNSAKHIWRFRDWIVESLNADSGYDEMVRLMLAADELHPEDPDKLRATGYLARNWMLFSRNVWLEETVEHVGKGLLGLTMNCSKCHAHKYDPISQEDFYRMRAFFEPYHVRQDVVPGEADLEKDGLPRVFDGQPDAPTYLFIRGNEATPDKSNPIQPGMPELIAFKDFAIQPVALPKTAVEPSRLPWVLDAHLATAKRAVAAAEATQQGKEPSVAVEQAVAAAKADLAAVEKRVEATRAAWAAADAPSQATDDPLALKAAAAAKAAAQAEKDAAVVKAWRSVATVSAKLAKAAKERKDAATLAGIEKELATARGAVETALKAAAEPGETFTPLAGGKWVQTRFAHPDKDDPPVAFQPQSTGRRTALAQWITDARNPLTARVAVNHIWMRHMGRPLVTTVFDFGRKGNAPSHPELLDWLASELVDGPVGGHGWSMKHLHRLIVTSAAYRMTSSSAGAGAAVEADPDNRLLWRRDAIRLDAEVVRDAILVVSGMLDPTMGGPPVPPSDRDTSPRRSLYLYHSGIDRSTFLATFDAADAIACYQRDQSIVPQQALALSNAGFSQDAAARIAARVTSEISGTADDETFVVRAFVAVLGRQPDDFERSECRRAIDQLRTLPDGEAAAGGVDPARVQIVAALLNHNDFVTLR
jgi:hypothetical protein